MSKLAKLQTKREVHREQVLKVIERIDKLETNVDSIVLESLLEQLLCKIEVLNVLNSEIDELLKTEDEIKSEILSVDDYNEKIISTRIALEGKIKSLKSSNATEQTVVRAIPSNNRVEVTAKLPKLSISKFYGEPSEYLEFWSQFKNSIHENATLSEIDKFCYLKSLLGGKALSSIKGFSITKENYEQAIKLINETFGQKDILINTHMSHLLNIKPVRNSSNVQALRNLYFECQTQIRCLESLGIDSATYNTLLTNIILKMLPHDLTLEFAKSSSDKYHDLHELMNFLYKAINVREMAERIQPSTSSSAQYSAPARFPPSPNKQKNGFQSTRNSSAIELNSSVDHCSGCLFCGDSSHRSSDCESLTVKEKRDKLLSEKRCLLCCKVKCFVRKCRAPNCGYCRGRHAKAICFRFENEKRSKEQSCETVKNDVSVEHVGNNLPTSGVLLQCVRAKIVGQRKSECALVLFDNGAQRSFIKKDLSRRLGLKILGTERLKIFGFRDEAPKMEVCYRVEVCLRNVLNGELCFVEALEVEQISKAVISLPTRELSEVMRNKGFALTCTSESSEKSVSLLIGSDQYWDLTKRFERLNSSLVAFETCLGWSLNGRGCQVDELISVNLVLQDELISAELRRFWELESLGVQGCDTAMDFREQEIIDKFNESVNFNRRYQVALPWKSGLQDSLDNNIEIARKRFESLVRKFKLNRKFFDEYKDVIDGYLRDGIVERTELQDPSEKSFYLPHHAVIRNDKTTSRLRIVFDGSSHEKGKNSLNDCLNAGPNLNPVIFELLLRFRQNAIAFTADVKAAFLQVELQDSDRPFTRFFWVEDTNEKPFVLNFTRVLFGLTSSPFLLAATIKHHLDKCATQYPETSNLLMNSVYVDDLIGGKDTVSDALKTCTESIKIFQDAGMTLRKWSTNSLELQELWKTEDVEMDNQGTSSSTKVLGLAWDFFEDVIYFSPTELLQFIASSVDTKRFVLKVIGRIFDPMGFLGPFVVRVKILLQEIWTSGLDWDQPLIEPLLQKWHEWCNEVQSIGDLKIPRYYLSSFDCKIVSFELHCFSDASTVAYGTVIYLRGVSAEGNVISTFVCSKSRVAPLKSLTLPRLELMGALLSARLAKEVSKCLKFDVNIHYWCDSQITLFWIKGKSSKYKPFVKNRVEEIHSLTEPSGWHFCPGKQNPADFASRGMSAANLTHNSLWWQGPQWLSQPTEYWPVCEKIDSKCLDVNCDLELKKNPDVTVQINCVSKGNGFIFNVIKYSNLNRLLRVTALVRRFVDRLRRRDCERGPITAVEIETAMKSWIRFEQSLAYSSELKSLKTGKIVPKESKISNLAPFLDDVGLIRVKSRIEEGGFSRDEVNPILLPKSVFVELLIASEHVRILHAGVSATLAKLRTKFWIPRGRQEVKRVLNKCLICRKYAVKHANQITAPLPRDRILERPPFSVTGIDFTGPVYIKSENGSQKKAYIALFTCGVVRAVHIELVSDLTTKSFILSLRRFLSRRNNCKIIISDNAKTFKNTNDILGQFSEIILDKGLKEFVAIHGITWKFIVPSAPWWGGFYERLMKSVKDPLRKILGRALLSFEEMTTILTEVECVLNHRPLTYVSNDVNEPQPLTPSEFLFPGQDNCYPVHFADIFSNELSTKKSLNRRKLYQSRLLKQIWRKWKENYLLQLRNAHHLVVPSAKENLKEGDVVLLEGSAKSKLLWPLGIVEETFIGRDGFVRSCLVRTSKGKYKRPIQVIYPLEISN